MLWFWLAALLWHLVLDKRHHYAALRSYGFTPTQIDIRAMRSQLSRAKKLRILWRDTFVCHICGKRGWWQTMEVEHVQALAQRGGNQDCNLKAAPKLCNRKQGARKRRRGEEFRNHCHCTHVMYAGLG
jgi:hypothetical protein